ncbi:MAG: hypothetical protein ABW123_18335 [Cystobacter sp.]
MRHSPSAANRSARDGGSSSARCRRAACGSRPFAALELDTKEFFVLDEVDSSRYPAQLAEKLMLPKASITMYV